MAGRTLDQSAVGGFSNQPSQTKILLGIAAIIAAAFCIDIVSPHDFTAGLLLNYFAIFLSSRLKTPLASFGEDIRPDKCVHLQPFSSFNHVKQRMAFGLEGVARDVDGVSWHLANQVLGCEKRNLELSAAGLAVHLRQEGFRAGWRAASGGGEGARR